MKLTKRLSMICSVILSIYMLLTLGGCGSGGGSNTESSCKGECNSDPDPCSNVAFCNDDLVGRWTGQITQHRSEGDETGTYTFIVNPDYSWKLDGLTIGGSVDIYSPSGHVDFMYSYSQNDGDVESGTIYAEMNGDKNILSLKRINWTDSSGQSLENNMSGNLNKD